MGPVVTGLLYFLVVTPIGWLRRTIGRSPLDRDRAAASFWETPHVDDPPAARDATTSPTDAMREILIDLFGYMRTHKKLWLLPLLLVVLALGALLSLAQGSALAPLIYSIF